MAVRKARKLILAGAALAAGVGLTVPAAAGGYYGHGYHGNHYGGHYGYGYRHHGYHRRHRGGGGKAAAIALGVIGGAIILNEIAENKADRRAYESRYYDRYDRYSRRATPVYNRGTYDRDAFKRGYEEGYSEGRGAAIERGAPTDLRNGDLRQGDVDDLDTRLDGGPEPIRFSAASAYQACMIHARAALNERGFLLAAPPAPETAEDTGGAWKMTANVSAQNSAGESWSRAMYCEADESRVYLLELI